MRSEPRVPEDGLALLVGAARSGTTLLRLILDAHPEVGCPAEAGLPGLMSHMAGVWLTVDADVTGGQAGEDPGERAREEPDRAPGGAASGAADVGREAFADLPAEAQAWIRTAVRQPMLRYTARGKKRLYVDKSLDSVHYLELVRELFPSTRHVLLFRHVLDTVASGIEASPWGFNAYGYAPYVQASPGNSVAALANYWLGHVDRALKWEEEHPEVCHRVRYEDLVLKPEETVSGILRFLGVREDLSVLHGAFQRVPARGPGDYKVVHTSAVHAASIGHGKRIPVEMLPPPLMEVLNQKLEALGYERLNRAWNAEERPLDGGGESLWAKRLSDLMQDVRISPPDAGALGSFAVVAEDHRLLRWVVQPDTGEVSQGEGEVDGVVTGTAEDLVLMLTGEENLGVLLRSGRVRHLSPTEDQAPSDLPRTLNKLVQLLRPGATHANGSKPGAPG